MPEKDVINEPAKNRLEEDAFDAIAKTSAPAPEKPLKGGADQVLDLILQTAAEEPGDEK